tara:strand:- start:125 stop:550 length:426 start_codon:yes stop_codon:yes gene_type:complete
MIVQTVEGGAYASLSVTIFTSAGDKEVMSQKVTRYEEERKLMDNIKAEYPLKTAEVVQSVSTKISDSVYWGEGTWDKIPFSVEVFSSVKLQCNQDPETIAIAQEIAHDIATSGARSYMSSALGKHIQNIKLNLFPGYFKND